MTPLPSFSSLLSRLSSAFTSLRNPPSFAQLRARPPILLISVIKATIALCLIHVLTFTDRYALVFFPFLPRSLSLTALSCSASLYSMYTPPPSTALSWWSSEATREGAWASAFRPSSSEP